MITVKILRHKGMAYQIEYTDNDGVARQVVLPLEDLTLINSSEALVAEEDLELGIPLGIPWGVYLEDVKITAKSIEKALLQSGVRTAQDCNNPSAVAGAVLQASAPILLMIQRIARNYRSGGRNEF